MTEVRKKILNYIRDFSTRYSYPPSVREIMRHLGFKSPRAISFHLEKLEAEGSLERDGKARGLRLKRFVPARAVELPIYGILPAKSPGKQSQLVVHSRMLTPGAVHHSFALRVKGDDMAGAQILDGDIAVVEPRTARPNDIVVASINGGQSLKRLVHKGKKPFLKSENPRRPGLVPAEDLTIQGVVTGIYRSLR
jgi:repressor LexA